jgi:hypothetical protein
MGYWSPVERRETSCIPVQRPVLRRRAEQIVRFARANILFYDEHVVDLYHSDPRALSNGVKIQNQGKVTRHGRAKPYHQKSRTGPVLYRWSCTLARRKPDRGATVHPRRPPKRCERDLAPSRMGAHRRAQADGFGASPPKVPRIVPAILRITKVFHSVAANAGKIWAAAHIPASTACTAGQATPSVNRLRKFKFAPALESK